LKACKKYPEWVAADKEHKEGSELSVLVCDMKDPCSWTPVFWKNILPVFLG
jgi:hypothetical protein